MSSQFQYWKHKKSGDTYAIKLRNGLPFRKYGPLKPIQYLSAEGKLLVHKLERYHYDHRFEDDPYHYNLCDGI